MKNNKVASRTASVSVETQEKPEKMEEKEEAQVGEDFNKDIKQQDEKLNEFLKVDEVDELMRFKRNVSVFLNVQCNSFFTQAGDALKDCLFYIGLYILLRRQINLHKELKAELACGKPKEKVPIHIWNRYQKSGAHSRISRLVECDIKHLLSYFKEVKARLNKSLEKAEVSNIVGLFQKYFLADEEQFNEEAYCEIMDELLGVLSSAGFKDSNLLTKLKMTENLHKYLGPHVDFGLFYEREADELDELRSQYPELKI